MSESEEFWYPKCIILCGCEVPHDKLEILINTLYKFKYHVYIKNGSKINGSNNKNVSGFTDDFYDAVSTGAFTKDNLYELRKYKTNRFPVTETFYLILNKIVIDISSIGNISFKVTEPELDQINLFKGKIEPIGLKYDKYVIIT